MPNVTCYCALTDLGISSEVGPSKPLGSSNVLTACMSFTDTSFTSCQMGALSNLPRKMHVQCPNGFRFRFTAIYSDEAKICRVRHRLRPS